jgi:cell division protein FtsN
MNKFAMLVCLTIVAGVLACGPKEEPIQATPPPAPQVQQTAPAPAPDPAPEAEAKPETKPVKKEFKSVAGDFTIQVASWATLEEANKLAAFYNGKGFEARVENADVSGGRWYRVRIGHYTNSGDAREVADQIAEKYKSDIWLVRL